MKNWKKVLDKEGKTFHVIVWDTHKKGDTRYRLEIEKNGKEYASDEDQCFSSKSAAVFSAQQWVSA